MSKSENPKFIIFTGPMFGGKTSRMLAALEREKYRSRRILACKPKLDHRYGTDYISTHTGYKWSACCVSKGQEIIDLAEDYDVVAVDEAFMIDGCAESLIKLFKSGKSIFVASIQLSANGNVFKEIRDMMPWATRIDVCPAICERTGLDAYYTVRISSGDSEIEVGGAETYQPRSWSDTPFVGDSDDS
jgi:thymidine kinase|tara:strand:- start:136 stop:699 length:564 start_codon:yes stop_codon:yes gene_type:complete